MSHHGLIPTDTSQAQAIHDVTSPGIFELFPRALYFHGDDLHLPSYVTEVKPTREGAQSEQVFQLLSRQQMALASLALRRNDTSAAAMAEVQKHFLKSLEQDDFNESAEFSGNRGPFGRSNGLTRVRPQTDDKTYFRPSTLVDPDSLNAGKKHVPKKASFSLAPLGSHHASPNTLLTHDHKCNVKSTLPDFQIERVANDTLKLSVCPSAFMCNGTSPYLPPANLNKKLDDIYQKHVSVSLDEDTRKSMYLHDQVSRSFSDALQKAFSESFAETKCTDPWSKPTNPSQGWFSAIVERPREQDILYGLEWHEREKRAKEANILFPEDYSPKVLLELESQLASQMHQHLPAGMDWWQKQSMTVTVAESLTADVERGLQEVDLEDDTGSLRCKVDLRRLDCSQSPNPYCASFQTKTDDVVLSQTELVGSMLDWEEWKKYATLLDKGEPQQSTHLHPDITISREDGEVIFSTSALPLVEEGHLIAIGSRGAELSARWKSQTY